MTIEMNEIAETDLNGISQAVDELKAKTETLLKEISEQRSQFECNLRTLRSERDEKIERLLDERERHLAKGDGKAADAVLGRIRKIRQDLENVARAIVDSDADIADLNSRGDELRLEACCLVERAKQTHILADNVERAALTALGMAGDSASHHIRQLERSVNESKKIAEKILAE